MIGCWTLRIRFTSPNCSETQEGQSVWVGAEAAGTVRTVAWVGAGAREPHVKCITQNRKFKVPLERGRRAEKWDGQRDKAETAERWPTVRQPTLRAAEPTLQALQSLGFQFFIPERFGQRPLGLNGRNRFLILNSQNPQGCQLPETGMLPESPLPVPSPARGSVC